MLRAAAADAAAVDALAAFLADARSPALVVGAGADDPETWAALVELAERLVAPVYQESFGARAGFPQDHRLFAGVLPADRPRLRERPATRTTSLLAVGAPVFRQSPWRRGQAHASRRRESRSSATTPDEVHRSPVELAVLAPPRRGRRGLAERLPQREAAPPQPVSPAARTDRPRRTASP